MSKQTTIDFPRGFIWGAATSSYQIEGGLTNEWSEWEKSEERSNKLKVKSEKEGFELDMDDFVCGKACNSFELFNADLDCLKKLGVNAYRFSLEWSRIEPEEGRFDEAGMEYYRDIVHNLKGAGIEPFVTVWHWTNPLWLARDGGWEKKKVVARFTRYARYVAQSLGKQVKFWATLNEPLMLIGHGYMDGKFPPNRKWSFHRAFRVYRNLIAAHKAAYRVLRSEIPEANIGVAMTSGFFDALNRNNWAERIIVKTADYIRNHKLIRDIEGCYDYIGMNYYHHDRLTWKPPFRRNEDLKVNDFGWEVFPEGIYHVINGYKKYKKPIYILENGTSDADDDHRADFIHDHLFYVHKAITGGADVRGYFHWSLLDNFEWADGYMQKFGLFKVDRETFIRTPRPSSNYYADICKNNRIMLN